MVETTPTDHPTPSTVGPTAPEITASPVVMNTTTSSPSSVPSSDSPAPTLTSAPATTSIPTTTTNGTASLAPGAVQSNEEPLDCTLNITTGVFGSSSNGIRLGAASDGGLDGDNTTTTAGQVVVPYTYQVETTIGVRDDITILDDVLLTLEYAMTERLIPLLLRDQCDDNIGGGSDAVEVRSATTAVAEATSAAAAPGVVVTGIAVAPPDEIDPDKTCRNVAAADDAANAGLCFVLNGRLTIHYQQHPDHPIAIGSAVVPSVAEERQQQQLVDHVRQQMEREIQSGRFDHAAVAPAITRVGLYVEDDDEAGGGSGGGDDKSGNNNNATLMLDQNTNKPLIGSLVGVFATVTIFATILIRRQWSVRRHRYNMAAGRAHS
jgi:hypothetical protein